MKSELRENGSRRRPPGGWEAFTKAIEEAARKRPRRRKAMTPAQLDNLDKGDASRFKYGGCIATTRAGTRCKKAPARGAQRCHKHGGLLEVPAHPANIRALLDGRLQPGHQDARRAFYAFDRDTRDMVTRALDHATTGAKRRRRNPHWPTLLAGAQALHADTSGIAFRRWLAGLAR